MAATAIAAALALLNVAHGAVLRGAGVQVPRNARREAEVFRIGDGWSPISHAMPFDSDLLYGDVGALEPFDIYPEGKIPGTRNSAYKNMKEVMRPGDPKNKVVLACKPPGEKDSDNLGVFLENISVPQIIPIPLPRDSPRRTDAAVLYVIGGGNDHIGTGRETRNTSGIATFLSKGISVFLLKYRVPTQAWHETEEVLLMDVQRSVSLLRKNHKKWHINPDHIGLIGVSAGGAGVINFMMRKERAYNPIDSVDKVGFHVNWVFFMYPAIPDEALYSVPRGNDWPPVLIVASELDRCIPPERTMAFYSALRRSGVRDPELWVYPEGGHGFASCTTSEEFLVNGTGFCMPITHFEKFLTRTLPIPIDKPTYPANYSKYANFKNPFWCPPLVNSGKTPGVVAKDFCHKHPGTCSGHCGSLCRARCRTESWVRE